MFEYRNSLKTDKQCQDSKNPKKVWSWCVNLDIKVREGK
jgi:hypothetical protein